MIEEEAHQHNDDDAGQVHDVDKHRAREAQRKNAAGDDHGAQRCAYGVHPDEQIVRATLGRLLFSGDETKKSVTVLSGGEKGRMIYGKLMLTRPNVMLMDEPTNHMDMETIESLQIGLEKYPGTLLFVSHDREFVGGLANRMIELKPDGSVVDFTGSYDEYLDMQGLDA